MELTLEQKARIDRNRREAIVRLKNTIAEQKQQYEKQRVSREALLEEALWNFRWLFSHGWSTRCKVYNVSNPSVKRCMEAIVQNVCMKRYTCHCSCCYPLCNNCGNLCKDVFVERNDYHQIAQCWVCDKCFIQDSGWNFCDKVWEYIELHNPDYL